jgi:hypothetical protein
MVNQIIFHPRVETELIDAFNWYEAKKKGARRIVF